MVSWMPALPGTAPNVGQKVYDVPVNSSRFESLTVAVEMEFPEYLAPPAEPMRLMRDWFDVAVAGGVREPLSLALATADERGRASTRIVAVIKVTDDGLVFTSHATSQKGRELAINPWASGVFYWRETGQQLVVSGPVVRLSDDESRELWFARATPLHAMTTVSHQSEPLDDPAAVRAEAARLEALGVPLPRPDRFVGYRLQPDVVEFWCARPDRLHLRLRYDRTGPGWQATRLQP
jgi:pyridoxamine 5'-phosphate oxidase